MNHEDLITAITEPEAGNPVQPPDETPEPDVTPEPDGMGERQTAVALAMIRDGRPLGELLAEAGVSGEEFADWVRAGEFPEFAAALARGFAQADAPYVWNTLLREAKDGNVPAIRLYFDIWRQKQPASASREGALRDPGVEALRNDLFGL